MFLGGTKMAKKDVKEFIRTNFGLLETQRFKEFDACIQTLPVDDIKDIFSYLIECRIDARYVRCLNYIPRAFRFCSDCKNADLPSCVAEIGENAFYGCTEIKYLKIPDSVKSIGSYSFANCTSLEKIEIPKSVLSIGKYAFYGCTKLSDVTILNKDVVIDKTAFWKCPNIDRKFRSN